MNKRVARKSRIAIIPVIVTAAVSILLLPVIASAAEDLTELVKKLRPTVVAIYTYDADGNQTGQGTGFFVSSKGEIITNYHVIQGAHSAEVKTSTEQVFKVKGAIAEDKANDLARIVLDPKTLTSTAPHPVNEEKVRAFFEKAMAEGYTEEEFIEYMETHRSEFEISGPIDQKTTLTFPTVPFSASNPEAGERIFVIGNPLGLEATVSDGIVSAVRDIPDFGKLLQITAPVSPGSSGSPVFNLKGEVVGVAAVIVLEAQNINFAVPVAVARKMKLHKLTTLAELTEADTDAWIKTAEGQFWLGNWCEEAGRYEEAIEAYKQAIRLEPDIAEAHSNLGVTYERLGRYQDAAEAYKQAIRLKPNLAEAHHNLGVAYGELGQYSEAVEALKQAIRLKPDHTQAYTNLGVTYERLGRYQDAVEAYKQAIRLKPDYAEAHHNLGGVYLLMNDRGSALDEYKILKELDAEKANKLFNFIYP